jgi:hypothetical protein
MEPSQIQDDVNVDTTANPQNIPEPDSRPLWDMIFLAALTNHHLSG